MTRNQNIQNCTNHSACLQQECTEAEQAFDAAQAARSAALADAQAQLAVFQNAPPDRFITTCEALADYVDDAGNVKAPCLLVDPVSQANYVAGASLINCITGASGGTGASPTTVVRDAQGRLQFVVPFADGFPKDFYLTGQVRDPAIDYNQWPVINILVMWALYAE